MTCLPVKYAQYKNGGNSKEVRKSNYNNLIFKENAEQAEALFKEQGKDIKIPEDQPFCGSGMIDPEIEELADGKKCGEHCIKECKAKSSPNIPGLNTATAMLYGAGGMAADAVKGTGEAVGAGLGAAGAGAGKGIAGLIKGIFGGWMGFAIFVLCVLAAFIALSDRRLKKNIVLIGEKGGRRVYEWEWREEGKKYGKRGRGRGQMVDEIEKEKPEAIVEDVHGYKRVNTLIYPYHKIVKDICGKKAIV